MNSNPEPIQPQEVTMREYFDMVIRHRWLVLLCFAVVTIITAIVSLTRPYEYMAASTFTVEITNTYGMSFGHSRIPAWAEPGAPCNFIRQFSTAALSDTGC